MKKLFIYILFFITLISIDLGTKSFFKNLFIKSNNIEYFLETNFLDIRNLCNDGISFGIFSSVNKNYLQFFIIVVFICLLIYTYFIIKSKKSTIYWNLMIVSGAMANLIDRLLNGCVYDFIDLHFYSYHWYVFNVADAYITIGAVFLIFNLERAKKNDISDEMLNN